MFIFYGNREDKSDPLKFQTYNKTVHVRASTTLCPTY